MSRTLSDEDRRAVDLILDQGAAATNDALKKVVPLVSPKRMASVSKVFAVLGQMPAEEPPRNLIEKTMRKIDRAASNKGVSQVPRRPAPAIRPA
jgi:hypothetical protein